MSKKLGGIVSIILSILIFLYFDTFLYKVLGLVGISVNNYSLLIRTIIDIVIKFVMCFLIYLLYRKDYNHSRSKNNIFKMILVLVVGVIGLTLGMYLFNYVVRFLGDIFNVEILDSYFYNIFDKKIDLYLIIKIITDYIFIPFMYCSIIILGTDKLVRRNDTFILFSGLIAGLVHALSLSGTLSFVIINSLSTVLLFSVLAFIYRRNNSIWFSILLYGLYLVSYVIILNYIGL